MPCEVTIGIPVYNAEAFVRKVLDTVLRQTFPDIEVLLVDDCSTDHTVDVVEHYRSEHPRGDRIRLLRQPQNGGPGMTRNRMIDEARGRYLYFMDADDEIVPEAIKLLYEAAQHYRAEVVYGSHQRIELYGEQRRTFYHQYPMTVFERRGEMASYAYRSYSRFQVQVWNVLIDIGFLRQSQIRFINVKFWEDMAFTYDLVTHVSRGVLLPMVTYRYVCRPNTLSNFQHRDRIPRSEIEQTIATINHIKQGCAELRYQPYVGYRSYDVTMNSFYMICRIIAIRDKIVPPVSDAELKTIASHPLTLGDILRSRRKLAANLFLWLLGHMPLWLFMPTVKMLGRYKKGIVKPYHNHQITPRNEKTTTTDDCSPAHDNTHDGRG